MRSRPVVTPDVEAFLAEIWQQPEVRAVAHNPKVMADFEGIKVGLRALYRAGTNDGHMIELFDDVRRSVARGDRTIKQRLVAIGKIFERARVGQQ
jgi:hypothetical protein